MRLVGAIAFAIVVGACSPTATPTPPPAMNVPCGPSEVLTRHEHAHLTIVIRGQLKTVPAFIGITATQICWLHMHDTSGIIHVEADDNRTFTLGDFFGVWRQPLSQTAIDGDRAASGESVQVTVNQTVYTGAPATIVLKDHQDIVLQLGSPFLTVQPYVWPPGY
ncbi:MAG: hypothetical protein M3T56_11280 [Chloroflexota bacterium]|nr:hypothetical protein [Chloroflexota bacterium]